MGPGRCAEQLIRNMRALLSISFFVLLAAGCYYDNEEELYGAPCDASVFSYAAKIQPILQANCYASACHGLNGENGELITYAQVQAVVNDGSFRQAVVIEKRMPDGAALAACELDLIEKWLDAGALNN